MSVVIWHNPRCATSRKVLEIIRAHGIEPTIVDYVKTPPRVSEIKTVLKEMGMHARELLRRRGTPYAALGLDDEGLSEAALVKAMHEHPILIERPVVRSKKGTRLCRPPEKVREIL